ncbi:UTP--glucose-1-phosphate uridylyltransferase [Parcubacteria bacterium SG8_24]|nr:MAG: UTP--glucose-1-phosphate uridylyltransferase [Parcubacteria bacterium SG8_24]
MRIRSAVIPVAGMGTRFLPATKAQPKEMLTLVDKPVIQYIVEEAVAAGIEQIIFVTSQTKRAIEDHFDRNFELEFRLRQKRKYEALQEVTKLSDLASFVYIRQKDPKGDGHAIMLAKDLVGKEPCAVFYGDDVVDSKVPCIAQLMRLYHKYQDPVIAVERVPKKDISKYGVIKGVKTEKRTYEIMDLVEKPSPAKAPSNLAIIGRYIITPEVFSALERAEPSPDGEIRLIDAFRALKGQRSIYACEFEGNRYDCGSKLGFLAASVDFGLKHKEVNRNREFSRFLKSKR